MCDPFGLVSELGGVQKTSLPFIAMSPDGSFSRKHEQRARSNPNQFNYDLSIQPGLCIINILIEYNCGVPRSVNDKFINKDTTRHIKQILFISVCRKYHQLKHFLSHFYANNLATSDYKKSARAVFTQ